MKRTRNFLAIFGFALCAAIGLTSGTAQAGGGGFDLEVMFPEPYRPMECFNTSSGTVPIYECWFDMTYGGGVGSSREVIVPVGTTFSVFDWDTGAPIPCDRQEFLLGDDNMKVLFQILK
jgi:hypothetical protein